VESAKFLNDMMDVFKISSSDITNKPFIEHICDFGKPVIISTGASYLHEIQETVEWIDKKNVPVALLHCVLNYPTVDENANLGMIKDLQNKFRNKIIGYSDHTLPNNMQVLEIATLLGATILEKHFTYDKSLLGNDHYHSMDKSDLLLFVNKIKDTLSIVGDSNKKPLVSEEIARNNARRSLVAKRDINKGDLISKKDMTWKRPAYGISPKFIDDIVGKVINMEIEEGVVLQWNMFK